MKSLLLSLVYIPHMTINLLLSQHSLVQLLTFLIIFSFIIVVRDKYLIKPNTKSKYIPVSFFINFRNIDKGSSTFITLSYYVSSLLKTLNVVRVVLMSNIIQYDTNLSPHLRFSSQIITIANSKLNGFMLKSSFIDAFWLRSYLIWNDGFLFDFAQKKTADLWVRKFVILTGFLFSDRYLFDSLVRIYNDNLITPLQSFSSSEVENVNSMLGNILFLISTLFISSVLLLLITL